MYNLQQQYIEQYLWEAVARSGMIDMRWQSEVTGLQPSDDGVTLHVSSPAGDYALEAGYVLAADGARSPVRAMRGLRLRGDNHEGRYVIADIRMDHDFPTERRAFFEPASNPGGTVLIHKQPDDIWRIDYQLRVGEDEDDAIRESTVRARVQAILDEIGHAGAWELEWWSIYTANTLCLDDYRDGRVIFIGDSAHIVPIFGVRGLNNGLADAFNIGWKLAYVLGGAADVRLLDSYTPERRGATLDVFANATRSTRFMTPPTRGWALAREAALSLAIRHDFARKFADPRQMQAYAYTDSPLTPFPGRDAEFAAGPASGGLAAEVKLADETFLLDRVGIGFTALLFTGGPDGGETVAFLRDLQRLDPRFTVVRIAVQGAVADGDVDDSSGAVAAAYGAAAGTLYLLRPDLHVAGRWKTLEPAEVTQSLRAGLGGRPS
jgi:3-(3-hydroxy-phenyl)propionate hydroxylase